MNGLPIIEDNSSEELKDEDLPVQPYRSKIKKIIKIEEYVNENVKEESGEINQVDEKIIKEDVIQVEEPIKEDIIQTEKSIDESLVQIDKSKGKESEIEVKKESKKKKELNSDISNILITTEGNESNSNSSGEVPL